LPEPDRLVENGLRERQDSGFREKGFETLAILFTQAVIAKNLDVAGAGNGRRLLGNEPPEKGISG
jgi:hypothetical protein